MLVSNDWRFYLVFLQCAREKKPHRYTDITMKKNYWNNLYLVFDMFHFSDEPLCLFLMQKCGIFMHIDLFGFGGVFFLSMEHREPLSSYC